MNAHHLTSLFTIAALLSLSTPAFAAFPDVPATHTDAEAISYLEKNYIFLGKPTTTNGENTFDPSSPLNRAELAAILIRVLGVDIQMGSESCFKDVQTGAWYFKAVCTAERMGIISGYPDGTFKPSQTVSKVEALKLIVYALGLADEIEMYQLWNEGEAWYSPYVTLAREWKLLDDARTKKNLDALMTRGDIAHLLYRSIITAMHRNVTGDIPIFSHDIALQYTRLIELNAVAEADTFEKLYTNGTEYRNTRLGFSILLPKTMPTYMCDYQKPAPLVDVKVIERGNDVYIGPAWYEENESLGQNPDGSGKYGECKKREMLTSGDEYFTRIFKTRIVKNDAEIRSFIQDNFGKECGPFARRPSMQNGIEDIIVKNVALPGVEHPSGLDDLACAINYTYVFKYNSATKRVLTINLGQDGFIYLPNEEGTFGRALDLTIMRTLRMF